MLFRAMTLYAPPKKHQWDCPGSTLALGHAALCRDRCHLLPPCFFCQPFRGMVPWTCPCLIWVYNPSVLFSQSENQLTNLIDPGFQAEGYPATAGRLTKGFWMTTFLVTSCFSSWSQKVKSSNLIVLLDVHSCQCLAMSFLVSFVFFPDGCHFF